MHGISCFIREPNMLISNSIYLFLDSSRLDYMVRILEKSLFISQWTLSTSVHLLTKTSSFISFPFKSTLSWLAHGDYLHFKLWFNVNVHHIIIHMLENNEKDYRSPLRVPFLSRKTGLCRINCLIIFSLSKLFQLFYSYRNWMVQFVHNIWQDDSNKKGFIKKLLKQWLVLL